MHIDAPFLWGLQLEWRINSRDSGLLQLQQTQEFQCIVPDT